MTTLLSDPPVVNVPILDAGEPLECLPLAFGSDVWVRAGLARRLGHAASLLSEAFSLRVVEGHRTAATQAAIVGTGLHAPGRRVVAAAISTLAVLSMVPLRGHALTYLAGGPAIATLTAVLLLAASTQYRVTSAPRRVLVWLAPCPTPPTCGTTPLTLWLRPHLGPLAGLVGATLCLIVGWTSHRYVEVPAQLLLTRRQALWG